MKVVRKKSYPELFEQVLSGEKTFDMRIADITIEPGDILEQVEVTHDGVPTGRTVRHTVGTVLRTKEIDFWPPEEIDRYINQIAFSGATDFLEKYKDDAATIIGHFGLGFYSSFMVSSRVDIVTKSYREGAEAVKWSCDGTPEFTLEPAEKAERGTDIVLHIDEENKEFLEEGRIQTLLNKYCRFLPIPVAFGKKKEFQPRSLALLTSECIVSPI